MASDKHASDKQASGKQASSASGGVEAIGACNVAVVSGECSAPEVRILESGTRLARFAIRAPAGDRATEGDRVLAVGRFRRRFFRSGGGVGSRVELEVERLARPGRGREVVAALRWLDAALAARDDRRQSKSAGSVPL